MKPAHEIKIRDLLGDTTDHEYKATWLEKEAELDGITEKEIAEAKKVFFGKMKLGISELEKPELADKAIKIYKNAAAAEFDPRAQIKDLKAKKNPAVTPGKIEWAEEDSGTEMVFQVNFASQEYGGGTFGKGFVQEEIKNVLSTTSSILTANKASLGLAPRDAEGNPTPVVIVGQIKDFTGTDSLPYGWKKDQWEKPHDSMIESSAPTAFNELAIAANDLGKSYGSDDEQSVKSLFNNALAGFKLAKEVADGEGKSCKIKTGLFGAGAFHNSPEFSIAMQYLAARIADVEIEFCGIAPDKKPYIEAIFSRVDEMIGSKMSLDEVVKEELLEKWKSTEVDPQGWRTDKIIPPLKKKVTRKKDPEDASPGKKVEGPSAKETPEDSDRVPVKSKDRWKISYPKFYKDENGKKGEAGKSWGSAKNNFLGGFFAILPPPFGREVKDKNGNKIKWPLGFISEMTIAVVDLALAVAWGVIEYVIPLVINTLTWPLRKINNEINSEKKPLEILTEKEVMKKEEEKEAESVGGGAKKMRADVLLSSSPGTTVEGATASRLSPVSSRSKGA